MCACVRVCVCVCVCVCVRACVRVRARAFTLREIEQGEKAEVREPDDGEKNPVDHVDKFLITTNFACSQIRQWCRYFVKLVNVHIGLASLYIDCNWKE